ncbi:MAG: hypothetical protein KBT36_09115 [Kurthia sp.]|nr:hypothetical protein [Candidatus Kurthia equi]
MIKIPVDLTGEQKTVLAIFSIRQLLLVFPVALLTIFNLIVSDYPFVHGVPEFLIKLAILLIANGISCSLAFIRIEKYDCYLSTFVVNRFKYWKSKKIYRL